MNTPLPSDTTEFVPYEFPRERFTTCPRCGSDKMLRKRHFESGINLPEKWCLRCQDRIDAGEPLEFYSQQERLLL